jgi:hypothetical protein
LVFSICGSNRQGAARFAEFDDIIRISMAGSTGRSFKVLLAALALSIGALFYFVEGLKGDKKAAAEVESFLAGTETAGVTFFQLDPKSDQDPPDRRQGPRLREWRIVREVPLTETSDLQRIRSLLTSPRTYGGESPRCFQPGMGLRFKDEKRTVEFVLCLDCLHNNGYEGAKERSWNLSRGGADRLMDVYKSHTAAKN